MGSPTGGLPHSPFGILSSVVKKRLSSTRGARAGTWLDRCPKALIPTRGSECPVPVPKLPCGARGDSSEPLGCGQLEVPSAPFRCRSCRAGRRENIANRLVAVNLFPGRHPSRLARLPPPTVGRGRRWSSGHYKWSSEPHQIGAASRGDPGPSGRNWSSTCRSAISGRSPRGGGCASHVPGG